MTIYEGNNENFEGLTNKGFILVDFYSDTCGPCKTLAVNLSEVNQDLPFINTIKVNTTKNQELAERFAVMAVPTIIFMKDGQVKERHVGLLSADEIKEKISQLYY